MINFQPGLMFYVRHENSVLVFKLDYLCHKDHWRADDHVWVCSTVYSNAYDKHYNIWESSFELIDDRLYAKVDLSAPVEWP